MDKFINWALCIQFFLVGINYFCSLKLSDSIDTSLIIWLKLPYLFRMFVFGTETVPVSIWIQLDSPTGGITYSYMYIVHIYRALKRNPSRNIFTYGVFIQNAYRGFLANYWMNMYMLRDYDWGNKCCSVRKCFPNRKLILLF